MNYKELCVPISNLNNENLRELINHFNASFNENEIKISLNDDNKIKVLLREIDISKLEEKISRWNDTKYEALFQNILDSILSIKSYGLNGNKRNYVDFNKERKVKNRAQKEENRSQYYYARNHDFSSKNSSLDINLINKIICGDSEQILKQIPDNSIDIIFTSPPYNFGLEYNANKDDLYWEDYFNKLFKIFDECIRVLKFGGRIIINIQPLFSDYIPSHHIISNFFIQKKLIWKGEILWEKNNYNCKYTAWGSWKSPSNPYLKYTWEFLEVFAKGTLKKAGRTEDIDIEAEEFKQWVVAKWSIAPERDMNEWGHPAMFPEKLVERVLKLFSYKNDVVLDPFNGVGTTTAVAKRLGRKYIGIDISLEYCEIAEKRTKSAIVETKLFNL